MVIWVEMFYHCYFESENKIPVATVFVYPSLAKFDDDAVSLKWIRLKQVGMVGTILSDRYSLQN